MSLPAQDTEAKTYTESALTEKDCKCDLDNKLKACRADVDGRINIMHSDMTLIREEMNILRSDVHRITVSTDKMSDSLELIAGSIAKLTDLPETWAKVKGFWSVVTWFKNNWFLFALLGGLVFAALWMLGIKVMVHG